VWIKISVFLNLHTAKYSRHTRPARFFDVMHAKNTASASPLSAISLQCWAVSDGSRQANWSGDNDFSTIWCLVQWRCGQRLCIGGDSLSRHNEYCTIHPSTDKNEIVPAVVLRGKESDRVLTNSGITTSAKELCSAIFYFKE